MSTPGIGQASDKSHISLNQTPSSSEAGKTEKTEGVKLGFSQVNSAEHKQNSQLLGTSTSPVTLPEPSVNLANVSQSTKDQLDQLGDDFEKQMPDLSGLFNELDSDTVGDVVKQAVQVPTEQPSALQSATTEQLVAIGDQAFNAFAHMDAIKSAPPEVMAKLSGLSGQLNAAFASGNMEVIGSLLGQINNELKDTRIKYDREAMKTSQEARKTIGEERMAKMVKALEKMESQKAWGIVGRVFGAIATALSMVVGTILIATGALSKVGIVLMVASMALMTAMTVSQNSGNWMNKVFGNNKIAQTVAGVMWSVITIALSLGANAATAKKASYDLAAQAMNAGKMASYAKMAAQVTKLGQATSMATSGGAGLGSATVKYQADSFRADAKHDTADQTHHQIVTQDSIEAMQAAVQQADEGRKAASDIIKEAFESKYRMSKNI